MASSDPLRGVRRTTATTNAAASITTADSTTTTTVTTTQQQRPSHRPLGSSGNMSSLSSLGASSTAMAGAADEDMFLKSFEAVPRLVIYSGKDVVQELTEITTTLSDTHKDWEKRVDALKRVRSLILAGGADFDEFFLNLKPLELAFLQSVRDLRSKVVRETCITIAFMSQSLRNRVDRFLEGLMAALFNLLPNSAKIMSTSGIVCIRFVIEYTHSPRLIPVLCSNMSSKAKELRKACCEFLHQMMYTWPTHSLEKHMVILQEAIKKGMNDADPEARGFSRKAFWGFAEHFKDQADGVLHSLDPQRQKALYGELGGTGTLSNSNSTHSLSNHNVVTNGRGVPPAVPPRPPHTSRTTTSGGRSVSSSNSVENLYRPWSAMSGSRLPHNTSITTAGSRTTSKIPIFSPKESALDRSMPSSPYRYGSAIDVGAARRARARAVIASAMANPNSHSHNAHNSSILSRSVVHHRNTRYESPIANAASAAANAPSSERQGRSNGRVSQSQPGSRSTSPSSFLSHHGERSFRVARKSSIPTATSRDPSPAPSRAHITDRSHRIRRTSDTPDASKVSELDLKLNNSDLDRLRRSSDNQEPPRNGRHATPTKESRPVDAMSEASGDGSSIASGDHCLDVLKPVIGELPSNQAAIKMLTKLVEQQPKSVVSSLLPDMMPALIQAYDSPDIAVRKAAVFAMVSINNVVGMDDLKEYLVSLNGSKMKLLNLYIERAKSSQASAMTTTSASSTSSITSTSTTTNNTNGTYETPTSTH